MLGKTLLLPYLAVIILSGITILPLFSKGFFPMHDDTQPARVYEMKEALSTRQFPVRWVGDLGYGYGYPLFNFYAPLPYYIGGFLHLSGVGAIDATKVMMGIGMILAGITMYLFASTLLGSWGGLIAAVSYMFAPYHALQLFVRGAVGELWAYGLLPLIGWGVVLLTKDSQKRYVGYAALSVAFAAVFLSHNITGFVIAAGSGVLIVGCLIYNHFVKKNVTTAKLLFLAFATGLGLSAFFILPAFIEAHHTRVEQLIQGGSDFRNHFVYLDQLWDSPWGYAGSAPGREDGMSFKIGKIHLILGLMGTAMAYVFHRRGKLPKNQLSIFNCQLSIVFTSVFMMLPVSQFIWEAVPFMPYIQYPWRFLTLVLFSISVLTAFIVHPFYTLKKKILSVILAGLLIILNIKYFQPRFIVEATDDKYISPLQLRYAMSKISDEYLPSDFIAPRDPSEISYQAISNSDFLTVIDAFERPTYKRYQVVVPHTQVIVAAVTYFPGWHAYINEREAPIQHINGKIAFEIPPGESTIELRLTDTPVRIAGNYISLLSIILLVYVSLFLKKSRHEEILG